MAKGKIDFTKTINNKGEYKAAYKTAALRVAWRKKMAIKQGLTMKEQMKQNVDFVALSIPQRKALKIKRASHKGMVGLTAPERKKKRQAQTAVKKEEKRLKELKAKGKLQDLKNDDIFGVKPKATAPKPLWDYEAYRVKQAKKGYTTDVKVPDSLKDPERWKPGWKPKKVVVEAKPKKVVVKPPVKATPKKVVVKEVHSMTQTMDDAHLQDVRDLVKSLDTYNKKYTLAKFKKIKNKSELDKWFSTWEQEGKDIKKGMNSVDARLSMMRGQGMEGYNKFVMRNEKLFDTMIKGTEKKSRVQQKIFASKGM